MFQKLYHHLEEISKSLRLGRTNATSAQGEIIDQLETMNETLVRLNQHLAPAQRSGGRTVILRLVTLAILIPLLIFIAFNLVQINRTLSNQAPQTVVMTPTVMTPSPALAPVTAASDAARLDTAGRLAVQEHLAKLDSLITEQNQTITELKRLNSTAVATMQRIRRHFILSEHIVKASWTQPVDSLAVAR